MTRHIKTCLKKNLLKGDTRLFHIYVSDVYTRDYFLHLLISEHSSMELLDRFLRDIWLECCGHMSAFSYERWGDEIKKRRMIEDVFQPGLNLVYQYDFGSTTELNVKCIGIHQGEADEKQKIRIIARNTQPIIPCDECAQHPAVEICTECQWNEGGWLCEACAKDHQCDEEMRLPVVNSPRTGVCGYTGEF
jgi:hypothetical protein